jgi:phosphoenolpyruvate phosphomutase
MVIWANHMLRASIDAMQQVAARLSAEESLAAVEHQIAPIAEIFRLQRAERLEEAERRYLPRAQRPAAAIILTAARGEGASGALAAATTESKVLGSGPLVGQLVASYGSLGIRDVSAAGGDRRHDASPFAPTLVDTGHAVGVLYATDAFMRAGSLKSLADARTA